MPTMAMLPSIGIVEKMEFATMRMLDECVIVRMARSARAARSPFMKRNCDSAMLASDTRTTKKSMRL